MGMQGTEIWAKQPLGRHNFLLMQQYNLVKILAAWEMRIEHPLLTGLNYVNINRRLDLAIFFRNKLVFKSLD